MKIVACSDTHGYHDKINVKDGDLFIFAGDFSQMGGIDKVYQFDKFLEKLPHKYKIVIAGNHDIIFEKEPKLSKEAIKNGIYLQDESVTINGIKIYGSPWQPEFLNLAFNLKRGEELRKKWKLIPKDTDILITHGPPYGILDKIKLSGLHVGCEELIKFVNKIKPKYHIFGHIHEGYGIFKDDYTTYVNVSVCNDKYEPINPTVVLEI